MRQIWFFWSIKSRWLFLNYYMQRLFFHHTLSCWTSLRFMSFICIFIILFWYIISLRREIYTSIYCTCLILNWWCPLYLIEDTYCCIWFYMIWYWKGLTWGHNDPLPRTHEERYLKTKLVSNKFASIFIICQ